jgi:hypothetical protein
MNFLFGPEQYSFLRSLAKHAPEGYTPTFTEALRIWKCGTLVVNGSANYDHNDFHLETLFRTDKRRCGALAVGFRKHCAQPLLHEDEAHLEDDHQLEKGRDCERSKLLAAREAPPLVEEEGVDNELVGRHDTPRQKGTINLSTHVSKGHEEGKPRQNLEAECDDLKRRRRPLEGLEDAHCLYEQKAADKYVQGQGDGNVHI